MRTAFGAVVDEARTRSVEFALRVPGYCVEQGSPAQYSVAGVLVELAGRREDPCDGLVIPMPDGDVALCREPYDHIRIVRHVGPLRCSAVSSLDDGEHEVAFDACFSLRVLR
ncbi:MAG: hypothetical protein KF773_25055 [Deltaproteobacteria bacterium]|nr:hypothetical protein [Deltaproteobacteria bacterium]